MRDKLISLIKDSLFRHIDKSCLLAENIADDLLENGGVVLPCKVGDTVYITENPYSFLPLRKVVEGETLSIHQHEFGLFVRVLFDTKKINGTRDYKIDEIGKTVFLTREEAEAKLKEGGTNGSE